MPPSALGYSALSLFLFLGLGVYFLWSVEYADEQRTPRPPPAQRQLGAPPAHCAAAGR